MAESGPADVYRSRLAHHRTRSVAEAATAARVGTARLVVFAVALGLAILAAADVLSLLFSAVALVVFVALVFVHGSLRARHAEAQRAARFYERGLDRVEDRWAGGGATGEGLRPPHHPYADDLDLFGTASLFQLLSTCRTRAGETTLAGWLLAPDGVAAARARQEAVRRLAPRLDLREDLALAGEEVASALDRATAGAWAEAPFALAGRAVPRALAVLGPITAAAFSWWAFAGGPMVPFLVAALVQGTVAIPFRARVDAVLQSADRPAQDLALSMRLLERFESEGLEEGTGPGGRLEALYAALGREGRSPSAEVRRLVRLMDYVDARRNQIFLPISWLFSIGTLLAWRIEAWRRANGGALVEWIRTLGELEALVSLSAYAYEHPEDPYPVLEESQATGGPRLEARGIGHPLLPAATNIRNDVRLAAPPGEDAPQGLLVSGSNMSGKSTLLRTVGTNVVLALAGAPVRATSLCVTALAVGAAIRVEDSLSEGASRFYAEIARLKQVVDAAGGSVPVLFLLDEMLGGTNSHDRRLGAAAVLHTLLDRGAIGLVTTHDLALAAIAKEDGRMANVHFEDRLEGDRVTFDYRMRPGVVERSNAIALMRAIGLEV